MKLANAIVSSGPDQVAAVKLQNLARFTLALPQLKHFQSV